jgi:hypothetical protein
MRTMDHSDRIAKEVLRLQAGDAVSMGEQVVRDYVDEMLKDRDVLVIPTSGPSLIHWTFASSTSTQWPPNKNSAANRGGTTL